MTATTLQKIEQKTGYNLEAFIQVVKREYQNRMSFNQIGRKYNVNHKLVAEVFALSGSSPRGKSEAIRAALQTRR